jgi:Cu/Ag efflux protein CusF
MSRPPNIPNIPVPDPSSLTTEVIAREVAHLISLGISRNSLVDERFLAINKLIEEIQIRHQQRFDAQTKALDAAFLSAQTAVGAALTAADKGIQAAMSASEKAVVKAEISAEKRFDSLMEFQKTISTLSHEQIPRKEAEARIDAVTATLSARIFDLNQKVDDLKMIAANSTGKSSGLHLGWIILVGAIGMVSTIIGIVSRFH